MLPKQVPVAVVTASGLLQKQPVKRKSSAAAKSGAARGSKASATAAEIAIPSGSAAGQHHQDWRTAKAQTNASAVPIGKQLKVSTLLFNNSAYMQELDWELCHPHAWI